MMQEKYKPIERHVDEKEVEYTLNEDGQTYGEWLTEMQIRRGSIKLRDAILRYLRERK